MDAIEKDSPEAPVALVALTALVYVAGFATVAAWFALLVLGPGPAPGSENASRAFSFCGVCGVVEQVSEGEHGGLQLVGDRGESFVMILASLGGRTAARPRYYETAVRHDDGTVRVVRDTREPQWKPGDRVRVLRGRIEPEAAMDARAAAGPGASPSGRTASPVPPVAQVP